MEGGRPIIRKVTHREYGFLVPITPHNLHSGPLSSSKFCVRLCKSGNYINDGLSKELKASLGNKRVDRERQHVRSRMTKRACLRCRARPSRTRCPSPPDNRALSFSVGETLPWRAFLIRPESPVSCRVTTTLVGGAWRAPGEASHPDELSAAWPRSIEWRYRC